MLSQTEWCQYAYAGKHEITLTGNKDSASMLSQCYPKQNGVSMPPSESTGSFVQYFADNENGKSKEILFEN